MMAQGATASIAAHPVLLVSISSSCFSLQPKSLLPCRRDQSSYFPSGFHLSLATSLPFVAFSDRDRILAAPRYSSSLSSVSLALARRCSRLRIGAQPIWKVGTESSPISRSERRNFVSQSQDCAELDTSIHEFHDDGAEVEVRVRIPDGVMGKDNAGVSARHVQVDAQDLALHIVIQSSQGARLLYSAPRLYGRIKSSETVWYVDEHEVVLSLKKMDGDVQWPALVEAWKSLTTGVSQLLKGTSVYVVGSSSDINWAVARELAAGLEYVPLQIQQLMQELTSQSPSNLAAAEGDQAVTEAESAILDSLSSHVRCVVATLGGNQGVGAQYGNWKGLHAGFTVWLSQTEAPDEAAAEQEVVKAKKEGLKAYTQADVVVALGGWDDNSARPSAEGALRALKYLLEGDKELPGKKSLYVRLGCRGDWPNIMPPGWNPASEKQEQTKNSAYY